VSTLITPGAHDTAHAAEGDPAPRRYHHADLTLTTVLSCVPAGSRRITSQAEARDAARAFLDAQDLRPQWRENLWAWIWAHIRYASWGGEGRPPAGVSSPGRATVCAKTGMSETTYKRSRRWWLAHGFGAVVVPGHTHGMSPGVLNSPGDRNTSQAYILCVPRTLARAVAALRRPRSRDQPCGKPAPGTSPANAPGRTGPLSGFSCSSGCSPSRARGEEQDRNDASCCYRPSPGIKAPHQTAARTPRDRGAARPGILRRGMFAPVSDAAWRHATRGMESWPTADLVQAVDRYPDGTPHHVTATPRWPRAVLEWRLGHWRRPDGTVMPSPSQARQQRASAHRERMRRQHEELTAAGIPFTDPARLVLPSDGPQRPDLPPPGAPPPLVGWAASGPAPRTRIPAWQQDPEYAAAIEAAVAAVAREETAGRASVTATPGGRDGRR
jgi:hypothetical protein